VITAGKALKAAPNWRTRESVQTSYASHARTHLSLTGWPTDMTSRRMRT